MHRIGANATLFIIHIFYDYYNYHTVYSPIIYIFYYYYNSHTVYSPYRQAGAREGVWAAAWQVTVWTRQAGAGCWHFPAVAARCPAAHWGATAAAEESPDVRSPAAAARGAGVAGAAGGRWAGATGKSWDSEGPWGEDLALRLEEGNREYI